MNWELLLGPLGLTVALAIAVAYLGRRHFRDDDRRDKTNEILTASMPELVATNRLMAQTIEQRLSEADTAPQPAVARRPRARGPAR